MLGDEFSLLASAHALAQVAKRLLNNHRAALQHLVVRLRPSCLDGLELVLLAGLRELRAYVHQSDPAQGVALQTFDVEFRSVVALGFTLCFCEFLVHENLLRKEMDLVAPGNSEIPTVAL